MNFTLLNPATGTVLRFPIPPSKLEVQIGPKTIQFAPINMGDVEIPKGRQPVRLTMTGLLPGPAHSLPGASRSNPETFIKQMKAWADKAYNQPLRFIVTKTPWNLLVFISQLELTHQGGHGGVWYTLGLTEWRQLVVQEIGSGTQTAQVAQVATKRPNTLQKQRTYTVKPGDSLWKIAQRPDVYGNGSMWRKIYEANKNKIKDPDVIYPGQQLIIP